jgi:RNase H-like domain found in reverse transcriptase/Integrase zinc binding domain
LGFTGYYRYFIKGYSQLAWPLLELTKKGTPWHWDKEQQRVLEELKAKMCQKPILANPDLKKTFYLQTDASSSSAGAVLSQEAENRKRRPVAYFSCTFSPAEANYDIYEKEFLAVMKAIQNWRAYLIWTEQPFIIETDHKNLTYWKEPKKLSGWTAHWHEKLQDYNFKIVHVPGKENSPANALSRMHQQDEPSEPKLTSLISPDTFLNVFSPGDPGTLEYKVIQAQQKHRTTIEGWEKNLKIQAEEGPHEMVWRDDGGWLIVPPDDTLKRKVLQQLHNHWGAGHPGRDETIRRVQRQYFWLSQRAWIDQYVKGCATCQQNKNLMHIKKTPLYKITVPENAPPFTQIALDLITGLPES